MILSDTLVIGLGNPLMGDDGFGLAVMAALEERALPPGMVLLDGGTGGLSLLHLWEGAGRVILVDAADMDRPAGTICHVGRDKLQTLAGNSPTLSLHHAGLAQVLAIGRELGMLPERLDLFAVQAESVVPGTGLSPPVAAAVEKVADSIQAELSGLRQDLK